MTIHDDKGNSITEFPADAVSGNRVMPIASSKTDDSTNATTVIDYPHHEIHSGNHYYMEGYTTLASEGILRVKLVTPDSPKWAHFTWSISSSGILTTTFHEGANGGMSGGAVMTPLNSNRNSTNTSGLVITSAVTGATSPGTRISNAKWGANDKFSVSGGGDARQGEVVLKQNTTHLRTFTSGSADNIIQFRASWYEHEDVS